MVGDRVRSVHIKQRESVCTPDSSGRARGGPRVDCSGRELCGQETHSCLFSIKRVCCCYTLKNNPPQKQQTNKQTKQVQHDFLKLGLRVLGRAGSGFLVGR